MAICAPAPERYVAARQDDVQMQPGELIQRHTIVHMIAATDSFKIYSKLMQDLSCRHFEFSADELCAADDAGIACNTTADHCC